MPARPLAGTYLPETLRIRSGRGTLDWGSIQQMMREIEKYLTVKTQSPLTQIL